MNSQIFVFGERKPQQKSEVEIKREDESFKYSTLEHCTYEKSGDWSKWCFDPPNYWAYLEKDKPQLWDNLLINVPDKISNRTWSENMFMASLLDVYATLELSDKTFTIGVGSAYDVDGNIVEGWSGYYVFPKGQRTTVPEEQLGFVACLIEEKMRERIQMKD